MTARGGHRPVVIYLPAAADAQAAQLTVAGRPVIFRAVAVSVRAGAARVLVPRVFQALLSPALAGAPRVARAVEWIEATTAPPGPAVLVPATVVAEPRALRAMLAMAPTAIHEGSRAAAMPIVVVDAAVVDALWRALAAGDALDALGTAASASSETTRLEDGAVVEGVRDAASAAVAERRLYTTLGSAIDTPWDTFFHRRFSRLVSRTAVALGLTPNTITLVSLVVGLVAVAILWRATPRDALLGLVVYAVAVIIDHADGEVARLTLTESAVGEWLDIAVDTIIHSGVVLAMGATSAALTGDGFGLGVGAAAGIVMSAAVMKVWPATTMPDRLGAAIGGIGNRDGFYAMLLAFIGTLALVPEALPWLMVVVAVGAHAYWVSRVLYRVARGA